MHDDTDNFFLLGVSHWNHDNMRVLEVTHVDKFHVAVNIKSYFTFFFPFGGSFLEFYVVDLDIELVAKVKMGRF